MLIAGAGIRLRMVPRGEAMNTRVLNLVLASAFLPLLLYTAALARTFPIRDLGTLGGTNSYGTTGVVDTTNSKFGVTNVTVQHVPFHGISAEAEQGGRWSDSMYMRQAVLNRKGG